MFDSKVKSTKGFKFKLEIQIKRKEKSNRLRMGRITAMRPSCSNRAATPPSPRAHCFHRDHTPTPGAHVPFPALRLLSCRAGPRISSVPFSLTTDSLDDWWDHLVSFIPPNRSTAQGGHASGPPGPYDSVSPRWRG